MGASVIWTASAVKALKPAINLDGNSTIYSGNIDPSSVSTPGVAGDVYISTSTNNIYVKQDSGSSTNWSKSSTLVSFTSGSVPFANGSGILTQDNSHFSYNNSTDTLSITNISATSAVFSSTISASNFTGSSSGSNTGDQTITLTGDISGSGTGSFATTLSTVNSNVGSFGTASNVSSVTVNGKGLITAAVNTAIQIAESQVTNLVSDLAGKQATGNYVTALTGDITASGPGSVAATLATVNSNVGSFGSSTSIPSFTVNAKGLITAASGNVVVAPAGTLSGTTLNSSVVTSSITSLGTQASALNMGSNLIDNVANPVSAQDAATKSYVDAGLAALNPQASVYAATVGSNIPGTYLNGTAGVGATFTTTSTAIFTLDGTTPPLSSRILIKDQSSGLQNGIYQFTTAPVTSVSGAVFTRTSDYNTASDMNSAGLIPVINGTVNALSSWQQVASITNVGVDSLVFTEFTANPSLYILKANNLSDVASASASFNNISPVTSTGDLIIGSGTNTSTRLAVGSHYQTVQSSGTTVVYDAIHLDQSAAVTGVLPNTNTTATSSNTNSTIVARDSSGNFTASTITAALTGTASGNLLKSTGDIDQTSFSAANNQSSAANVTGLAFSNATVRSFEALVSVFVNATSSLYEGFTLRGIQRGADWQMSNTSVGDASGFTFSITSAGQVQYTSNNYTGFSAATVKFRALTLAV